MALIRRFRSPVVALVAVVFSASIALAGQPAGTGLANATQHAGKTVPVQAANPSGETDETTTETTETDDTSDSSADNCNVDLTQDPSVLAGLNHGSVVCTAAQMATPDGYANHGAWVSHWAKMNKGADASAAGKAHQPSH
jgi:hypothetical protein